jgi:hypothetical protein
VNPEPGMIGRLQIFEPFEYAGESVAVAVTAAAGQDVLCEVRDAEPLGDAYSHVVLHVRKGPLDEVASGPWECSCIPIRSGHVESEPRWGAQHWRGGLALRGNLVREKSADGESRGGPPQ